MRMSGDRPQQPLGPVNTKPKQNRISFKMKFAEVIEKIPHYLARSDELHGDKTADWVLPTVTGYDH